MTAQLCLVEDFVWNRKKYDCKIILSWTDCKSKLDQQCKKTLKYEKYLCIFNPNKKYVGNKAWLKNYSLKIWAQTKQV